MSLRNILILLTAALAVQAQSYQLMFQPGESKALWAGCLGFPGGQLIPNCLISYLRPSAYIIDSNGHTASRHATPFPASKLSTSSNGPWLSQLDNVNTGPSGQFLFYLGAGQRDSIYSTDPRKMVAHQEYIVNQPASGIPYTYQYAVGWSDIHWVEEKPQWIHVGARIEHMNSNAYNHWMTTVAGYGIWNTAVAFLAEFPAQTKIAVNDMALPFGGLFDISGGWEPSHWNHGRGIAVDVRGNGQQYAIPDSLQDRFVTRCVNNGAMYGQVEYPGTSNQHIHCQWPNP